MHGAGQRAGAAGCLRQLPSALHHQLLHRQPGHRRPPAGHHSVALLRHAGGLQGRESCGVLWCAVVWYDMVWYDMVWYVLRRWCGGGCGVDVWCVVCGVMAVYFSSATQEVIMVGRDLV